MVNDVARAFFEAPVTREVCIELPMEDLPEEEKGQDLVGLLKMSLYGARDAAANFQREVGDFMRGVGFTQVRHRLERGHRVRNQRRRGRVVRGVLDSVG